MQPEFSRANKLKQTPTLQASSVTTEDLYRFLVESTTEYAIFAMSGDGTIVSWNTGATNVFGYSKGDVVNCRFDILFTAEDRAANEPAGELQQAQSVGRSDCERWHVRSDGTTFWATNTVQPMRDERGAIVGFTKIVRDATERYQAVELLRQSQARFRVLAETVADYALFAISPDGTISIWNAGAEQLFGYRADEIVGRHYTTLYLAEDVRSGIPALEIAEATEHGNSVAERWLVRRDGTTFFSSGRLTRVRDNAVEGEHGFVRVAHDITERKAMEEKMRYSASHDALTGLPNRTTFIEHLTLAIALSKPPIEKHFAVFFLDVDDFKAINDSFGHMAADRLLIALAERLHAIVRDGDLVARIGGDEFAMLLTDLTHTAEADALVRRICLALAQPFEIDGQETYLTISTGIAFDAQGYSEPEEPLRDADIAMYAAKARGRSEHTIFAPEMRDELVASKNMDTQIRRGLERSEFRVVYQPIVSLAHLQIVGFEALVRWEHPTRGLLLPSAFLETARKAELIIDIDRLVLQDACRQVSIWHDQHPSARPISLSVNLSSRQFERDDLVTFIRKILKDNRFAAAQLNIEITEHTVMQRSAMVLTSLEALRRCDIQLSIDDFGTGYSSLSYLSELPVTSLKIDRSFIDRIGDAPGNGRIVGTIVDLAHNLGLEATAEGIETDAQLVAVRDLGCDFAQGYLFSRPVPWLQAEQLLTRSHAPTPRNGRVRAVRNAHA